MYCDCVLFSSTHTTLMKKLPLLVAALCSAAMLHAQILARQYFTTPQKVNPAMTGFIPSDLRVTANSYFPSDYWIMQYAADASLLKGKLPKGDALGVGVSYEEWDFVYKTKDRKIGAALAYHKALGKKRDKFISAGVQSVLNIWRNEGAGNITFPTHSFGLMYTMPVSKNVIIYAGYATYMFRAPKQLKSGFNTTFSNYTKDNTYAGAAWSPNNRFSLYASALLTDGTRYLGSAIGEYLVKKDSKAKITLAAGCMYYHRQTISPYIGVGSSVARLGISYGIATESPSLFPRRFETSLVLLGRIKKQDGAYRGAANPPRLF